MPEGPEIRLAADEIAGAIAGRAATEVYFAFDHLKSHEERLAGVQITAVETKGKAILIRFANGWNIYSHNQLYGKWFVRPAGGFPNTNRQLRLAIHNRHQSVLLYSASDIEVLRDAELADHPFLSKLGPDLLDELVTVAQVIDRCKEPQFRRRRFTSLLLDQGFIAGLGNYLRSEVMFVGQIHPALRPADCSAPQIRQVAQAALDLTRQSYQSRGVTNDLALAEQLRRQGYAYHEYRFRVFNRDAKPCYACGTPIIKDILGGRRFYYCPTCQAVDS